MEDESESSLDIEFRRYLHILRPYLVQIVDEDLASICNAWLRRLTDSTADEKTTRNQYVFTMCYQLSQGMLDEPFIQIPPAGKLQPLRSDDNQSDDSLSELECIVINNEDPKTKVLFGRHNLPPSTLTTRSSNSKDEYSELSMNLNDKPHTSNNGEKCFYTGPNELKKYITGETSEVIGSRANNLIMKLREMKKQNLQLFNELQTLKRHQEDDVTSVKTEIVRVDETTSACINSSESSTTLKSLKEKLHEAHHTRTLLIQKIEDQQEKNDNFEDMKRHEIEDINAKHKIEIINIKTAIREESNKNHNKKIDEMRVQYETRIKDLQQKQLEEIKEKFEPKDKLIGTLKQTIKEKDDEINTLKQQLEYEKDHIRSVMTKYFETSHSSGDNNIETLKFKTETLQEQLSKMEKAKLKSTKYYEAKLSFLQKDKQLADMNYKLQSVSQRTQTLNEFADETQSEVTAAIEKLENKYKEIVANIQVTAIQRRVQDHKTLESILQTVRGNPNFYPTNFEERHKTRNNDRRPDDDFVSFSRNYNDDSFVGGYCLDSGKISKLIDKIYIPQKDTGNTSSKQ